MLSCSQGCTLSLYSVEGLDDNRSGGVIDIDRKDTSPQRWGTWEYNNTKYQPSLYHN